MMDESFDSKPERAEELAKEIRMVVGRLKRRLRERSERTDFTPSQTSVLLRLEANGPATIAVLARAEGMRHQSMSAVVGPLQDAGLIKCDPDPHDRRRILLSLSAKCLRSLQKSRAARQDWLTRMIGQTLSASEQERLRSALKLLDRLVEE